MRSSFVSARAALDRINSAQKARAEIFMVSRSSAADVARACQHRSRRHASAPSLADRIACDGPGSAAADSLDDLAGAAAIRAGLLIDLARTFAGPADIFATAGRAGPRLVARMHLRFH